MELVKKNILSIICGVVALAAIAFHFVYTTGQFSELETKAQARADKAKAINDLLKAERSLPAITDAAPPKLERFPNAKTIEVADGIAKGLNAEATKLIAKAVEINRTGYDLLVPGSLPRPIDPQKYDFRDAYNDVLTPGKTPKVYDPQRPLVNLPDGVLQSAAPPTELEIAEAKVQLWKETYAPKVIVVNNVAVNQKEVISEFLRATAKFDEEFRRKRAESYKVYLEPGALGVNPNLLRSLPAAPSAENMWYGQMAYWVQRDVCVAIAKMNKAAANIPAAPVKHLVAVDIKQDVTMYAVKGGINATATGGGAGASTAAPAEGDAAAAAAPADGGGAQPKDYTLSSTGRVCNPMYDVVHFDVVVVVDAAVVQQFLRMLQQGRFINVVHTEMQNVDLAEAIDAGYAYGRRPVVELTVKCEALFLRDWTVRNNGPMPQVVQQYLGIAPAGPPAPTTPPTDPAAVAVQ